MPSARSAALAILASSSPSSVVVKRTWPASVWRWMKVALSGAAHQLLAVLRGHLDEIAEHVVVPDLQRAHAGLVGVARLQRGDHPARFVAQRARLVERGVVAGAHEAAVALEQRQFVGERRRQLGCDRGIGPAQRRRSAAAISAGSVASAVERVGEARRCRDAVADGGEVARAAAADHQPRQRARQIGRRLAAARARRRAASRRPRTARPRRAAARSRPGRSAARPAAAPAAASPPPSRCGRWRRAASRAARRRACASVRDWRASPGRSRASRPAPRAAAATAAGACRAACAPHR